MFSEMCFLLVDILLIVLQLHSSSSVVENQMTTSLGIFGSPSTKAYHIPELSYCKLLGKRLHLDRELLTSGKTCPRYRFGKLVFLKEASALLAFVMISSNDTFQSK